MEVLRQLADVAKRIGYEAYIFIVLSFVALYFGKELGPEASAGARNAVFITAGGLFSLGVLLALLKLFAVFFTQRPARGLIDGLAAGILAGLIGGYFGYGWHHGPLYIESPFHRTLLCVLFATPVGGLLGLVFDLFHPDRPIPWRRYAGVFLLGLLGIFLIVGYGMVAYVPTMRGKGLSLSDLQLLFEVFLLLMAGLTVFSFGWPAYKIAIRSLLLVAAIVIARALTYWGPQTLRKGALDWDQDFVVGYELHFAATVIAFMIWSMIAYAVFFKDHALTRFLDRRD